MVRPDLAIEVKRRSVSPLDLAWFPKTFPGARLIVTGTRRFEADSIRCMPIEELLLADEW